MAYETDDRARDNQTAKDVRTLLARPDPEPDPEPGVWVWDHDGTPWTPADWEDHLDRHIDAPPGKLASMKLELGLTGMAERPDLQNLIAWLVGRKGSGAGSNNQMLAGESWGFGRNRFQFRMGWEVEHSKKSKNRIRPVLFNSKLTHTVDYIAGDNMAEWMDRLGHHGEVGEYVGAVPIIGAREDGGNVSHGLHLSLGGVPFNEHESSCVGIYVNSCRVTLGYQKAA